ncbi:MAG: hypothetical protein HY893_03150 [Deltaproteobacteria bacterium]|nr:hypothetical protein [Deltaproteobacteria bacterium]
MLLFAMLVPGRYGYCAGPAPSTAVRDGAEPEASPEAPGVKDKYQRQMEERLNEFEKRTEELQSSARKATGEGRRRLDKAIEELREKEDGAREQLEALKKSVAPEWDRFRARLNETADEIERSINDAFASI